MSANLPKPSEETTNIRQAVLADADALRELRLEGLRLSPEAFGSDYEREVVQPVSKWQERLGSANNAVFVAEGASGLVGMTGIYQSDLIKLKHNATVYGVYVRPKARGRQLAQGMLAASFRWARQRGLKYVKLAVISTNTAAICAYQKAGFRVYGVDPAVLFHAGTCYDELLMAYEL